MNTKVKIIIAGSLSLLLDISVLFSQEPSSIQKTSLDQNIKIEFNEEIFRTNMKKEGLSGVEISGLAESHKKIFENYQNFKDANIKLVSYTPTPMAACGDMGAENGWGSWSGSEGSTGFGSGPTWSPLITPPGPTNTNTAFIITSGAGTDPCTAGAPVANPAITVVAPGFGNSSFQLGVNQQPGAFAERMVFQLTVTPQDTNFIYAYAAVIEDAGAGHSSQDQPYVSLCIKDANGNNVPCGCFKYIGGPNLPGFFPAKGNCGIFPGVYYKPWTIVGVNLSNYVGQTLTITIENVDCALGAHFTHSYWDFKCGVFTTTPGNFCVGQSVSITAPSDPAIGYTYQWFQNGQPYTGAPNATSQTIVPFPQPGDTFSVILQQPSGCNFYITYAPQVMNITPNFSYNGGCGAINFTDLSTAPNNVPMTAWNWSFPGGVPATSTAQNPANISFPPGTYSISLIVTSQNGCKDTITLPVTVLNTAVASFTTTPVCEGMPVQFTNTTPGTGLSYSWDFPGGNPATSTIANPSVVFPAGTYTATLTTALATCTATATQTFVVSPNPVAAFTVTPVCFNNPSQFANQSTGGTTFNWNFGDGNASTLQSPSHTYATGGSFIVTLIVSNPGGCLDTTVLTTIVNPLPVAMFSSPAVCLGDSTCFNNLSTVSPGTITAYSWNFGDPSTGLSNTSSLQNPCHLFSGPGLYSVILTVTSDQGCQSNTTIQAKLNPPPVAGIISQNSCLNSSTTFSDASTAALGDPINSWNWNFGDGSANTSVQNPAHTFVTSGTYTATLIVVSQNGCKDTITYPVTIYQPPVALFTGSGTGCAPLCVNNYTDQSTSADGNITSWQWSFPGGMPVSYSGQTPASVCYNAPGTYGASLVVTTNYGCTHSVTITPLVNVYPWPTADFCVAPDMAPVDDPVFSFCDLWSSNVTNWVWSFGDNSFDSVNTDPVHNYSSSAFLNDYYAFNICVRVETAYGCWDTACHSVEILPEFTFYIPNSFTPNGDYNNEVFFGKGRGIKDYSIWLFDRWGNRIWDCHHEDKNVHWDGPGQDGLASFCKWDGKVVGGGMDMSGNSGQLAQEDVYVWKVSLIDIFDKKHSYVGHVSVVR